MQDSIVMQSSLLAASQDSEAEDDAERVDEKCKPSRHDVTQAVLERQQTIQTNVQYFPSVGDGFALAAGNYYRRRHG